ncbi:MAG TPA: hypothetical protein VIJ77_00320 [Candidatus Tumulicola sp.]
MIAYLDQKQLLIIFDNCEHVIGQARAIIGSMLRECPHLSSLVTSREALSIAGERVYRMPPLAVPVNRLDSAEEAATFGAVALFADRARAADSRFEVTADNVADVIDICRRLDGLPLAIELAAARAIVLSPRQIATRLAGAFEVLDSTGTATIPRHQTMRAAIDWSYTLLSSQPRLLFERLSTFAGGFTLESAIAVCADDVLSQGDVLELLTSLVARSLVMVDFSHGEARYHLLDATRHYAIECLAARGQRERFAQRHARAYLTASQRLDETWYDYNEREWFALAEADVDNYRVALEWSLAQRRDLETGRRLAASLARVWYSLSPVEGRRWVRLGIESVDEETPRPVAALLNIADAELCGALGEYKSSLDATERAMRLLGTSSPSDRLQEARAKQGAGSALSALGNAQGEVLLNDALRVAQQLGNQRLQALVLGDLGTARSRRGDISGARLFYAEALTIYKAFRLDRPAASIAGHLAEVEFAAGDASAALLLAREALRGHEATHNRRSIANDLCNIAAYLLALDRHDDAREYAASAVLAARDAGGTVLTAYALQHVAAVFSLRPLANERLAGQARERAAMIIGFVDARLAALQAGREYTEQQEYARIIRALKAELAGDKFRGLTALGTTWKESDAIALALDA